MILNFRNRGAAMITRSLKRLCWKLPFKRSTRSTSCSRVYPLKPSFPRVGDSGVGKLV